MPNFATLPIAVQDHAFSRPAHSFGAPVDERIDESQVLLLRRTVGDGAGLAPGLGLEGRAVHVWQPAGCRGSAAR